MFPGLFEKYTAAKLFAVFASSQAAFRNLH